MSKYKTSRISKIITCIFLLLIMVALIGFIIRFTNGGTTDLKTFYVQVDQKIYTDDSEIDLLSGITRFETKYVFASNKTENHKGYKISIVPNVTDKTNFDFIVNGQVYAFGAERDLTEAFKIEYDATGFTLGGNVTIQEILQKIYDGKTVETPDINIAETAYFNLIISAYNDSQSIVFGLRFVGVTDIILSPDKVVI